MHRSSALYILKLKEQRRVTQVAIDDIVEGTRGLFFQVLERTKAGVRAILAEAGVDSDSILLDDVYKSVLDPFSGIHTCYLQEKYFHEKLNLIVSANK